jgi:DNA-binding cell septation regulator SpoVG
MNKSDKVVITEIDFYPVTPKQGVVCFSSFIFQNALKICDVAIITRPGGGYRLSYPLKLLPNGKKAQSVYPINTNVGKQIEETVLKAYCNFLSKFGIKEKIDEN